MSHQTAGVEQVPAACALRREENPHQLFPNSLGADFADRVGRPDDRFPGRRLDFKVEHGGEADRAQKPQPVFRETLRRVANRPHEPGAEVLAAADEINHGVVRRIEEHAVNREIAAARVFFRRREVHFCRVPAVEISAVGPESRDLELQVIFQNDYDAEMRANRVGAAENLLHLGGVRVGRDIDIFRNLTADEIAHAAACEVGGVAGCAQSIHERTSGRKHRFFLDPGGIHILTLAGRAPPVETGTYSAVRRDASLPANRGRSRS